MNFIDVFILIPLGWGCWKGYKHGLIIEVFTFLALLVGIYAGIHFSDHTALWMQKTFDWQSDYLPVIACTVTFLAVGAMVYFAGIMIQQGAKVSNLTPLNKFLGLFFGLVKMMYAVSMLLILLESYDEKNDFLPKYQKEKSLLYTPVLKTTTVTIPAVKESTIFIKNKLSSDSTAYVMPEEQTLRAREIADSLGVEANNAKELYDLYKTYDQKKKKHGK